MEKKLIGVALVLVILNIMFAALWLDARKKCNVRPVDTASYDTAMSVLEQQRNRHAMRADKYEAMADSLAVLVGKKKREQSKTRIQYVQDVNAWRALPDNARDERINYFTKELATVDSIAEW